MTPKYAYGAETTLASLIHQWIQRSGQSLEDLAKGLECNLETVQDWLKADELPLAVYTVYKSPIEVFTDIRIDNLLIIESKRRILRDRPELEGIVTFDRFQTFEEILGSVREASDRYNGVHRLVERQLGIEGGVSRWLTGRYMPSGENLDACIIGVSRGFSPHSRDGLYFRLMYEDLTEEGLEERFPHLSDFNDIIRESFGDLRTPHSIIANKTGIKSGVVADLKKWEPTKNTSKTTLRALLGVFIKKNFPDISRVVDEVIAKSQKARKIVGSVQLPPKDGVTPPTDVKQEATPVIQQVDPVPSKPIVEKPQITTQPEPAPVPRLSEPVQRPPAQQVQTTEAPQSSETVPSAPILRVLQAIFLSGFNACGEELNKKPGSTSAEPQKTSAPSANGAVNAGDLIGQTIDGVRHCLGPQEHLKFKDPQYTLDHLDDLRLLATAARKILLTALQLPEPYRSRVLQAITGEIRELFLTLEAGDYGNLSDALEALMGTRTGFNDVLKGLKQ